MNRSPDDRPAAIDALLGVSLTEAQRLYATLYYIDRVPMRRIAESFGVNVSTVSRTIARASERLKRAEVLCRLVGETKNRVQ